jgi:F0F1-type ATP synthase assembly protein I
LRLLPFFPIISIRQAAGVFAVDKNQNENKKTNLGVALRIFGEVSAWVVAPIVLALILGKFLDRQFDTVPWIFLALTGLAFLVSIAGIWKILTKYIQAIEREAESSKKNQEK